MLKRPRSLNDLLKPSSPAQLTQVDGIADPSCLSPPNWLKQLIQQPKWYFIYYILAGCNVVTMLATLSLNHQITCIYDRSVTINQTWATRQQTYSQLGTLAIALNAPGNNVFNSRNIDAESKELKRAAKQFHTLLQQVKTDLTQQVSPNLANPLLMNLDGLDLDAIGMQSEAELIFSYLRQNQIAQASIHMSNMDQYNIKISATIAKLREQINQIQQQRFAEQHTEIAMLKLYEYVLAGCVGMITLAVTAYGLRLAQTAQQTAKDREQAIVQLQQTEAYLLEKNQQLEQALQQIQQTPQLIQTEKMASLGQLVAGVAHEINNPVNFIYGNLKHTQQSIQDLLSLIALYQTLPDQDTRGMAEQAIAEKMEEIDFDYLVDDLPKQLASMQTGADRIRQIVLSLRTFSRLDESDCKTVNLHDGIDSTLLLLQHRFKSRNHHPCIQIIKEYGDLPLIECYAGQLNQVFMNILANALDALEECMEGAGTDSEKSYQITIRTSVIQSRWVQIEIVDNGVGMTEQTRQQIFDPFFTTKPVGKGTGMGMSISYQIITEKHGGHLECYSTPGQGTEFIIQIPIHQRRESFERSVHPCSIAT
ncbi:ATP-binding protein [Alkalinema sp. FACHB-956]|uniref:sensor histidine kinase n=1 Tax=Alkalinema sp. FACHB-956 TaxID=2692768 RepID=UPI0032204529